MPPSGVDYASEFLNGYAPEYVVKTKFTIIHMYHMPFTMKLKSLILLYA